MTREIFMKVVATGVDYCLKMFIGGTHAGVDEFLFGYSAAWTDMWLEFVGSQDWYDIHEMLYELSCELQAMALEARFR